MSRRYSGRDNGSASQPPKYTIDLSLEPRDRYTALAEEYKERLQSLTGLFNSLLQDLGIASKRHPLINSAAGLLLRKVHSRVETAELRGLAETAGISMYLLVSFNVILDLLMGCTSGAVKSLQPSQPKTAARMLHFRTLDWGMDPLRSIIVQLDFVRSKSATLLAVIASSITYVGFVGVLTGVRPQLSLSLNFRAVHDATTRLAQFRFYLHHVLVLLGIRPSISSLLRGYLFTERGIGDNRPLSLAELAKDVTPRHTTAAYLIFCDGKGAISVEKDYGAARVRHTETFIATTNHDLGDKSFQKKASTPAAGQAIASAPRGVTGIDELVDESKDRLDCLVEKWQSSIRKKARWLTKEKGMEKNAALTEAETILTLTQDEIVRWVSAYPTTNEETHFAAVLDPQAGQVVWSHAYPKPAK